MAPKARTIEQLNEFGQGKLPGLVGMEITGATDGRIEGRLPVRPDLLAPNGYLHAASVIALADTCCGYGTVNGLPEGAAGFTTIELKTNFLGTVRDGMIHLQDVVQQIGEDNRPIFFAGVAEGRIGDIPKSPRSHRIGRGGRIVLPRDSHGLSRASFL